MKIGITGHQNIKPSDGVWLIMEIEKSIKQMMDIEEAYSCLAIGADQLFASIVLANNIPLTAITPCKNYQKTFDEKNIILYKKLLNLSAKKIQLDHENKSGKAFLEAGQIVVDNSDVVFAIWDGTNSKEGGTADIVAIAERMKKKIIHFNPANRTLNHMNFDR
jgi:uncharacterized phage-like protein YoqJ